MEVAVGMMLDDGGEGDDNNSGDGTGHGKKTVATWRWKDIYCIMMEYL